MLTSLWVWVVSVLRPKRIGPLYVQLKSSNNIHLYNQYIAAVEKDFNDVLACVLQFTLSLITTVIFSHWTNSFSSLFWSNGQYPLSCYHINREHDFLSFCKFVRQFLIILLLLNISIVFLHLILADNMVVVSLIQTWLL